MLKLQYKGGLTKYDSITFGEQKQKPIIFLKMSSVLWLTLPSGIDYRVQLIRGPHGALDIEIELMKVEIGVVPSSLETIQVILQLCF